MDVNLSRCIHCKKQIHYSEARLLPQGGGVCQKCASEHGYTPCQECQDYFIPYWGEIFCECCSRVVFEKF
jgi:hypothetical protein